MVCMKIFTKIKIRLMLYDKANKKIIGKMKDETKVF